MIFRLSRYLLWLTDFQVEFNTHASSEWDSFSTSKKPIHQNERLTPDPAHFMHLPTGLVYNGAKPTIDAFQTPEVTKGLPTLGREETPPSPKNTRPPRKRLTQKPRLAPTRLCDTPRLTI